MQWLTVLAVAQVFKEGNQGTKTVEQYKLRLLTKTRLNRLAKRRRKRRRRLA